MELTIDKRKKEINIIHNLGLSYWDMLYWQNNKVVCNDLSSLNSVLYRDIEVQLNELYDLANKQEYFEIRVLGNESLNHYYDGMLKKAKKDGDIDNYNDLVWDEKLSKSELAEKFAKQNYEEYKHLVNTIKQSKYSDSFKCLILKEALTKVYKQHEKDKIRIENRKIDKNIDGIPNFSIEMLDFVFDEAEGYNDFSTLYIESLNRYQKEVLGNSASINLDINTFDKGRWIKFEGKDTAPEHFEENVNKLKTLVANTNWCTDTLAGKQLSEGDFYVFVDNTNEPRIAVKMSGDSIDEVRGRANGNGQELEEEYRDVAIEFLCNNKEIKNAKEWLDKEEWNNELLQYISDIDSGKLDVGQVGKMLSAIQKTDYRGHGLKNMNLVELVDKLYLVKNQIAQYYGYKQEEVWVGDCCVGQTKIPKNIKLVIGDVQFFPIPRNRRFMSVKERNEVEKIKHSDFLSVERVIGNVDTFYADIEKLTNLKEVYGNLIMSSSKIKHLGVLTNVYGNLGLANTPIESLGDLVYVSKKMDLTNTKLLSLGKLKRVGESLILLKSELPDTGELEEIGGSLNASVSKLKKLIKVKKIGNTLNAIKCELEDLGELEFVGNINLCGTKLTTLNNVKEVLYNLDADKNIKSLGKLEKVGDRLDISRTGITKLDKIKVGNELVVSKYNLVDITDVDANKVIVFDNKGRCDTVMDKESYVSMASNCLAFV